jgi:hypothetical protein
MRSSKFGTSLVLLLLLTSSQSLVFPPFGPAGRKCLHDISHRMGMKSKSHGNDKERYPVVTKTHKTRGFDENAFRRAEKILRHNTLVIQRDPAAKSKVSSYERVKPKAGDTVGQNAKELGDSKGQAKAKAWMEKMGWKSGEGLGAEGNTGMALPIEHVIRYSRAGLG